MNFYIDKPTLRDIPAMRNLVLPEVQRGIILDRTEDEMAGAIRSYSVIRIAESSAGNLSLELHSADFANLGLFADLSPVSHPKFAKNHESQTENPSVVDSANLTNSQNLNQNNPRVSANLESRPLRGAKNRIQGCRSATADFLLEAEKRGSPPKSEKAAAFWRVGGAGRGVQPFLREKSKLSGENGDRIAESSPIVAFAALQILSLTLAEVRSLIVAENYRRNGLATMLIEHLIAEARALNLKEVLALTYQREVFEKLGFKEIAKESLPNQKIWADCIKCKKFPVCDEIALTKIL